MRAGVIAAGAVLALAVVAWWDLREHERGGGVVLAARRPHMPWDAGAPRVAAPGPQRQEWVQSEADRAWCGLALSGMPASDPVTADDFRRIHDVDSRAEQFKAVTARLESAWIKRLRARGDERSQAVADLLDGSEEATRHLIETARTSRDPAVYAWALLSCRRQEFCVLSARRWAEIDPGSLAPWMLESTEFRRSDEWQTEPDAVYRSGLATRDDDYSIELQRILRTLFEARAPGLQMEAEWTLSEYRQSNPNEVFMGDVLGYCEYGDDPSRLSACLAVANALWLHAQRWAELVTALRLAKYHLPDGDALWDSRRREMGVLIEVLRRPGRKLPEVGQCTDRRAMKDSVLLSEIAELRKLRDTSPP